MMFLTNDECRTWCAQYHQPIPDDGTANRMGNMRFDLAVSAANCYALSARLSESIGPRQTALLWVTADNIWPSSTNLHLYYKLRQAYGDRRLLARAPGHLFLDYEMPDLVSFIQVALLSGWDAHLFGDLGYGKLFVSHDSWVEVWRASKAELDLVATTLQQLKSVKVSDSPQAS